AASRGGAAAPSCRVPAAFTPPSDRTGGLGFGQVALERERVAGRPAGLVVASGEAGPAGRGGRRRPRARPHPAPRERPAPGAAGEDAAPGEATFRPREPGQAPPRGRPAGVRRAVAPALAMRAGALGRSAAGGGGGQG